MSGALQKVSRIWVRPLENLGFEVMCTADVIASRRIGFRQQAVDANELASDIHRHAVILHRHANHPAPRLELWEAPDGTA